MRRLLKSLAGAIPSKFFHILCIQFVSGWTLSKRLKHLYTSSNTPIPPLSTSAPLALGPCLHCTSLQYLEYTAEWGSETAEVQISTFSVYEFLLLWPPAVPCEVWVCCACWEQSSLERLASSGAEEWAAGCVASSLLSHKTGLFGFLAFIVKLVVFGLCRQWMITWGHVSDSTQLSPWRRYVLHIGRQDENNKKKLKWDLLSFVSALLLWLCKANDWTARLWWWVDAGLFRDFLTALSLASLC